MSNGLESRLVESVTPPIEYTYKTDSGVQASKIGDIFLTTNTKLGLVGVAEKASLYELVGYDYTGDANAHNFTNTANFNYLGAYLGKPQNNPITLDNSNSSAYKHLMTIGKDADVMAHLQVFSQEMISNVGAYDGDDNEFTQLTNGTLTDDNGNTIITKVSSIPLNIYLGDE